MDIYAETNIGLLRATNQDSFKHGFISDNCAWAVVCDGMGGANGGDVASNLACQVLEENFTKKFQTNSSDEELMLLSFQAVEDANKQIYTLAQKETKLKGMGTTLVSIFMDEKKMCLSNIGDSRAYLKRGNSTMQITVDHSFVQELVDNGQITPEQARIHPQRNRITRALGVHETVENDYSQIDLEYGDIIVSCTDGLSAYITEKILNIYLEKFPPKEITSQLIKIALDNGGADNVTVCVIYL